jgi:hypothetical protein
VGCRRELVWALLELVWALVELVLVWTEAVLELDLSWYN